MRPRGSPRSQPVREPTLSELALAEIKAREEQEKPFGGWGGEMVMVPATLQAPPMYTPRYRVPEVDWREEERERAARERQEHGLDEEEPGQHPPAKREPA